MAEQRSKKPESEMPFLKLTIYPAVSAETIMKLTSILTDLMRDTLSKKAELTSVLVEAPSSGHWTIGGTPVLATAMLEVNVTDGTNTDVEKEMFIAAANKVIRDHIPNLDDILYIVIREIPANSWGYDGLTQSQRRLSVAH